MKVMILAAGRGERLKPITDHTPKPLVKVHGLPLIEHHIIKLAHAGLTDIVVNVSYLAEKLIDYLGDGSKWQVNIQYSHELPKPLETAGGIIHAMPLLIDQRQSLSEQQFLVINGDIFTDWGMDKLPTLTSKSLAHLWLVDNPEHHPLGDFYLHGDTARCVSKTEKDKKLTFSGIGLYKASIFAPYLNKKVVKLGDVIKDHAEQGVINASHYQGSWTDVGTVERLEQLNQQYEECK
ncbi:N-acetylmuramate alpha-1-phosphate uridylyltransferase MurU [Thalassotalea ganghwensis]